jgi:polysaccharide pyruvyl transferase WcaK-like protein
VDHQISIGGLLQNISSERSFYYYITMMNFARSNILFGQSLGPFTNPKRCYRAIKNIKGLTGILLRDWESYRITTKLFEDQDVYLEYGTDIAFNLDMSPYVKKINKDKYVLIIIKKREKRSRIAELIGFIKKYLNMNIVIGVFDIKDKIELQRIKHNFYEEDNIKFVIPSNISEAINLVYNSKYILSWRFHPIILAIIFNKPFLNLAFNQKIINFLSPYIKMPYTEEYEVGFEYMLKNLDVDKIRKKHFKLANKNITFLRKTLNNNIFGKKLEK